MIDSMEIWRQRSWRWLVPLVFLALNIAVLMFFQSAFAGRLDVLEDRYDEQAEQFQSFRDERQNIETFLEEVKEQERQTGEIYRNYFGTENERHIAALREIRTLARRAGLDPTSFTYPEAELTDYDLNQLGIQFGVEGTYDQLRTFINFLELTDQFLSLERVSLGGGEADRDARLKIGLMVSTIFANEDSDALKIDLSEVLEAGDEDSEQAPDEQEPLDEEGPAAVEETEAEVVETEEVT